jgi:hypothetical protein
MTPSDQQQARHFAAQSGRDPSPNGPHVAAIHSYFVAEIKQQQQAC